MSTVAQFIGALLVLAAFALTQRGTIAVNSVFSLTLNAVGAAILAVLALAGSQWGFLALEGTWAIVSVAGLIHAARAHPGAPPEVDG